MTRTADDRVSDALDRLTNKVAELEQQVRDLSQENSQLRTRESRSNRTESERAKLDRRLNQERALEAVRQLLRQPYVTAYLPTVHRLLDTLAYRQEYGTLPKEIDVATLMAAREELAIAKDEALPAAEAIRDSLGTAVRASQLDRQEWLDNCSPDLRKLWHLGPVQA